MKRILFYLTGTDFSRVVDVDSSNYGFFKIKTLLITKYTYADGGIGSRNGRNIRIKNVAF